MQGQHGRDLSPRPLRPSVIPRSPSSPALVKRCLGALARACDGGTVGAPVTPDLCPHRDCRYSSTSHIQSTPRLLWAPSPWGCPSPWTPRSWVRIWGLLGWMAQAWLSLSTLGVEGGLLGLWDSGLNLGGWHSRSLTVLGHPCVALSQWHVAHCPHLSPAPFGVKQEQLSPRGQAGPPESLGVPTAQETSVLRGEALG